jgi:hypothetical protein
MTEANVVGLLKALKSNDSHLKIGEFLNTERERGRSGPAFGVGRLSQNS